MNHYIVLTPWQLFIASFFIFFGGLFSFILKLNLEKRLFIAAARTVLQLSALGFVLEWIFEQDKPILVLLIISFMLLVAGREAAARSRRYYPHMIIDSALAMAFTAVIVGTLVTQLIIGVKPWYHPQYVIPLIGMILGNSLNGVSLALDHFLDYMATRREEVELFLVFGANRLEALRKPWRVSIRRGLIPIINAMSVAGIVSLPGIMTGQILAGASPVHAVAYQILIMFMLAGSYLLGTITITFFAGRRLLEAKEGLYLKNIIRQK